jgi:cardiolipin synthase
LLLGTYHGAVADIARPMAWAFTIWGTALYLWSGVVYLHQISVLVRHPVAHPVGQDVV